MHADKSESDKNIVKSERSDDIEFILYDLGGSYGKFQLWNYFLFSIPIFLNGLISQVYVFTTLNVDYRCHIPECEFIGSARYDADWVQNAVPFVHGKPSKCYRFEYIPDVEERSGPYDSYNCQMQSFNRSNMIRCENDGLIYLTDEISIANQFGITCEENEWQLAAVGAYNNIVRLICMPLFGLISDRNGRRTILITTLILSSIAGVVQSFSINYTMFIICEVFSAMFSGSIFTTALILGLEWAGSRERVMVNAIITFPLQFGIALIGFLASIVRDFRQELRMTYGPTIIVALIVFLGPESFRWLLAKGKRDEIHAILAKAAKINKCNLSPRTYEIVERKCKTVLAEQACQKKLEEKTFISLFTSRTLFFRLILNALCYITGNYVTQGITIIAVSLQGDKYMNYIILSLGSVPSCFISILLLKYVGRRSGISICFLLGSVTVVAGKMLPDEYRDLALMLFLSARCFVIVANLIIYVYSAELWPTNIRATAVGISSMLGRLGSVVAPLAPLLSQTSEFLPFLSFGVVSLITGMLVLILPETKGTAMPETIDDALNLGKKTKLTASQK